MNISSLCDNPPPVRPPMSMRPNLRFTYPKGMREDTGLSLDYCPDGDASIHVLEVTVRASPEDIFTALEHRRAWTYADWDARKHPVEWAVLDLGEAGLMECTFGGGRRRANLQLSTSCRPKAVEIVEMLLKKFKRPREPRANAEFQIMCRSGGGDLMFHDVPIPAKWRCKGEDLALLYGESFAAWSGNVGRSLSGQESGIILLSGDPGTGKTCFLRHLIAAYSRRVDFIYLPPIFFASAASPEVITTWVRRNMKKQRPSVLLIEDAEDLLVDGEGSGGRTTATSNLLNAADGLLGDVLKAKIICSFNCPVHRIDKAVIRPDRLKAAWKFEKLPRHRAEGVRERFDLPNLTGVGPFSLAEIFRNQPLGWESLGQEEKTIGFAA